MPRHNFTLECLSPLSHGDVTSGIDNATNTRLFLREDILFNDMVIKCPTISENAIRTCLFRLPLHNHLIEFLGIRPGYVLTIDDLWDEEINKIKLNQSVVNLLTSGGNLKGGAKSPTKANELGHKLKQIYPSLDLLGGATDNFILPAGKLKVLAYPITIEYHRQLRAIGYEGDIKNSAFELISVETKTRGTGGESEGNQMLYAYETMVMGSQFFVELTLDRNITPVAQSALSLALSEWDGYFGGQGRQGKGRMQVIDSTLPPPDLYLERLEKNKEAMLQGLLSGDFGTGVVLCAD